MNFATLCNIRNRKSTQRQEPLKEGAGTRSTRNGKREIQTPLSLVVRASFKTNY